MTAQPGQMLSHYRLLERIGEGGMGVVWKAFDTKLGRHIALKVLPPALTADPERRRRMLREARAAATVTHPNIATIYEVGEFEGITFISMELVDGRTLRSIIGGGPMRIAEALRLGAGIAEGLVRAHQAGIVHRDLKPDNILIGADGRPKILDFGLAKIVVQQREAVRSPASEQQTRTQDMTREGTILGTPAYMSPEQVRGEAVDARSDVFAFGVMLYEMVTGQVPFRGGNRIGTLAAILNEPAVAASRLNTRVPAQLDDILGKCLDKDAGSRYQSTQDLAVDLRRMARTSESGPSVSYAGSRDASTAAIAVRPATRRWIGWAAGGLVLLSAVVWGIVNFRQPAPAGRPTRFVVLPPENTQFGWQAYSLSVSPDGSRLALLAIDTSGKRQIWIRDLESLSAQPLPGTELARELFWSPDSRFIAFGSGGKLKKMDLQGGREQTLCDAPTNLGGTWSRKGVILFAPDPTSPIHRISAAGGPSTAVTSLDSSRQETGHHFPFFLPDGNRFLYLAQSRIEKNNGIWVGALDGTVSRQILADFSSVKYAPPGYLLFVRDRTLMAQRFDADSLELTGDAIPIADRVQHMARVFGVAAFSVSETGVLVFRSGAGYTTQLTWFDRSGKSQEPFGKPGAYFNPELSPDGKRVAVGLLDEEGGSDLWLMDLLRGTSTRFTFDDGSEESALWSPDGRWVAFGSRRFGQSDYHRRSITGPGDETLPLEQGGSKTLMDLSADGRFLLYAQPDAPTGSSLWAVPLDGDRKPLPFLKTPFVAQHARFSPDGRWVAYACDESGRFEIYVESFPTASGKRQVSVNGGTQPRWRRDGKELFFVAADGKVMAAAIRSEAALEMGPPAPLFEVQFGAPVGGHVAFVARQQFDVTADGQRFLINRASSESPPVTVVLNWTAGLKP